MPLDDQDRKKGLEILKKMDLLKNDETPVSKDLLKQIIDMLFSRLKKAIDKTITKVAAIFISGLSLLSKEVLWISKWCEWEVSI